MARGFTSSWDTHISGGALESDIVAIGEIGAFETME
jgi:hypothetical protein